MKDVITVVGIVLYAYWMIVIGYNLFYVPAGEDVGAAFMVGIAFALGVTSVIIYFVGLVRSYRRERQKTRE